MPGGRRAGPTRTRARILEAARAAFAARGYDAVSLRAVAREAGADPALVHHFFGTKARLFAAAVELTVDPRAIVESLLAGDPATLGERLVRAIVELGDSDDAVRGFLALIRGAVSHADAARLLREFISVELLGRIARVAAPDAPQARAALAGSQIIGLAMARRVIGIEPLAGADADWLAAAVGPSIQRYLTEPLPR
jgi:AcrR family transcriptional regulator